MEIEGVVSIGDFMGPASCCCWVGRSATTPLICALPLHTCASSGPVWNGSFKKKGFCSDTPLFQNCTYIKATYLIIKHCHLRMGQAGPPNPCPSAAHTQSISYPAPDRFCSEFLSLRNAWNKPRWLDAQHTAIELPKRPLWP